MLELSEQSINKREGHMTSDRSCLDAHWRGKNIPNHSSNLHMYPVSEAVRASLLREVLLIVVGRTAKSCGGVLTVLSGITAQIMLR
jgi:hypothetical protein